jgi:hypothetical protein
MVMLEYIGASAGTQTWFGPVTGTRYLFGGNRKVGYVDGADADEMLILAKGRKPVFRVFEQPKKAKKAKAKKPKAAKPVQVTEMRIDEDPEVVPVETKELLADPGSMSVKDLESFLTGLKTTSEELQKMLDAEISGQNRVGARKALEDAIATG